MALFERRYHVRTQLVFKLAEWHPHHESNRNQLPVLRVCVSAVSRFSSCLLSGLIGLAKKPRGDRR